MKLQIGILASLLTLSALPQAYAQVYPLDGGRALEEVATLAPTHLSADLADVEATNLAIDGHVVYVTYNTAGAGSAGAFEAVDISDIAHPRSLNVLKYDQFEFADVAVSDHRALIVGQENTSSHQGAVLKLIDLSCPSELLDMGSVALKGYAATSVQIDGCEAIVSTGDNGSIDFFDLYLDALPTLQVQMPLANALYASEGYGRYFSLGGAASTNFTWFNPTALKPVQSVQLSAQETPSPARFQLQQHTAFINAGSSGLSIVDLDRFSILSQLPVPGTGNGLDVLGNLVFLAQGEDGIAAVDTADKRHPRIIGNIDFHEVDESTNQIRFYHDDRTCMDYLLAANGRGGLRIFRVR